MTLWAILGALIGLIIGVVAGLIALTGLAPLIGYLIILPGLFGTVAAALAPSVVALGLPWLGFLFLWMIAMIVLTLVFYLIATLAIRPIPAAGLVAFTASERFGFGVMIGINVGVNATIWLSLGIPGAVIAAVLALVGLLALFPPISTLLGYQVILGWTSWLMPLSWPANLLGLPIAIILGVIGRIQFGTCVFSIEFETGSFQVVFLGPVASDTGFSLGHFNVLVAAPGTTLASITASTAAQDIPAHESGHTLNTGAFGSAFLALNGIEENLVPGNGAAAYGELCAESNARDAGRPFIDLWDD